MFWKVTGWPLWIYLAISSLWILFCSITAIPDIYAIAPFIFGFFFSTEEMVITSFGDTAIPEIWSTRLALILFPPATNYVLLSDFFRGTYPFANTSLTEKVLLIFLLAFIIFAAWKHDFTKNKKFIERNKGMVIWVIGNFAISWLLVAFSLGQSFLGR